MMFRQIQFGVRHSIAEMMEIDQAFGEMAGVWLNPSYRIADVKAIKAGPQGEQFAF
jgi:hypothetical protein